MKYHIIIAELNATETNKKVQKYFEEHPKFRETTTIDELARAIGCPKGSIGKTTAWKGIMESRNDDKEETHEKVRKEQTPEPESYGRYLDLRKERQNDEPA